MTFLELAGLIGIGYITVSVVGYTLYLVIKNFRIARR